MNDDERFLKDFPAHERTTRAAMRIPRTYQALGRLEESLAAYDAFLARPLPAASSEAVREEHAELMMAALEAGGQLGEIALATFDLSPEVLEAVEAGDMLFAIDQAQYLQGYLPIVLLTQFLKT